MSFPKIIAIVTVFLFGLIGILAFFKGGPDTKVTSAPTKTHVPVEVVLEREVPVATPVVATVPRPQPPIRQPNEEKQPEVKLLEKVLPPIDEANRIEELFNKGDPKLPIVETITYKSRVAWQKGRPAWLSDYANYYSTSRHFIARSLNGKSDYFKQDVSEGDRFNVLRKDKNISFYLLLDISRAKMWFYYVDQDANERVLLKTYIVSLGRMDKTKPSGTLTPLGKYSLGNKIAIYKPKTQGIHNNQKIEMIRVFGSRWIPFDKEISGCTAPAKGFGIHGIPWLPNSKGELVEDRTSLGKFESDGCIRLSTEDMEELFAIIITKPATIELVKDFHEAKPPGIEKQKL